MRVPWFVLLYTIFVGPVLLSLWRETQPGASKPSRAPSLHGKATLYGVWEVFGWFGFLAVGHAALCAATRFVRHEARTPAARRGDVLQVCTLAALLATAGGVGAHIGSGRVHALSGLSFLPLCACYLAVFTLLFEATDALTHLTLTAKLCHDPVGLCIVGSAALVIVWFLYHHLVVAAASEWDGGWRYRELVAFGALGHAALLAPGAGFRVHVHHWYVRRESNPQSPGLARLAF
jgi:hypothetical protein